MDTIIGDHVLITMNLKNEEKTKPQISFRRDWSKYSKEGLLSLLSLIDLDFTIDDVQANWNKLEEIHDKLINSDI